MSAFDPVSKMTILININQSIYWHPILHIVYRTQQEQQRVCYVFVYLFFCIHDAVGEQHRVWYALVRYAVAPFDPSTRLPMQRLHLSLVWVFFQAFEKKVGIRFAQNVSPQAACLLKFILAFCICAFRNLYFLIRLPVLALHLSMVWVFFPQNFGIFQNFEYFSLQILPKIEVTTDSYICSSMWSAINV